MSKMDNRKMTRKAFGLLITILLVFIFSILSLWIVENKVMSSNIDKYKYIHIQAKLHMNYIVEYITKYNQAPSWDINSDYQVEVIHEENSNTFDIFITPKEDIDIRLHHKLITNSSL